MTAEPPRPLHGLMVLVIDDHRDTVEMLQEFLTASGARTAGAGSAKAAMTIVESLVIDAAVIDLHMPREDGWWFVRELRASRTPSAHAVVFAMSGSRHDDRDPSAGFAGYFLKPVDLDALVAALSALPRRSS